VGFISLETGMDAAPAMLVKERKATEARMMVDLEKFIRCLFVSAFRSWLVFRGVM